MRTRTLWTASLLLTLVAVTLAQRAVPSASATTFVGPKSYYLALGDSLAYGYQPSGDYSHGYTNDYYADLQTHGAKSFTNLACPGETSNTFLKGGCPYWYIRKTFYLGSQMNAALNFIKNHSGSVSPVTIDIGANDALGALNASTCTVASNWQTVLATFDTNFNSILSQLQTALGGKGDLVTMNLYDPFQNQCSSNPQILSVMQTWNAHVASDAAAHNVAVADVYTAFGASATPDPYTCTYTWMCSSYNDIHPTGTGYYVIAGTFEAATGY